MLQLSVPFIALAMDNIGPYAKLHSLIRCFVGCRVSPLCLAQSSGLGGCHEPLPHLPTHWLVDLVCSEGPPRASRSQGQIRDTREQPRWPVQG